MLFFLSAAFAVPVEMTHQGELLNLDGSAVTGSHVLSFKIYGEESGGASLWQESVVVEVSDGFYSAQLGATTPLDSTLLAQHPLFLELTVDANAPMSPRHELTSVPYAVMSDVAESVEGGSVNATDVSINGTPIIDSSGNWVGPEISGGGGSSTPGTISWSNVTSIPSDIADGDNDTLSSISCNNGEVLGWDGGQWLCLAMSGGSTGGGGATLTESQVEAYVTNDAIDLYDGTTVDGYDILTTNSILSTDWSNVTNKPSGFSDDTDNDTLAALNCANGETVLWNSILGSWVFDAPSSSGGSTGGTVTALSTQIGTTDGGLAYPNLDGSNSFPDNNVAGFTSARYIADSFSITTLTVNVAMTHPDVGEVTLKLTSPEGTELILYDGNNPGQADLNTNFGWDTEIQGGNRYAFYDENVQGPWTLNVVDSSQGNTGTLDSWTLHFNEGWDGELVVGHKITVQETLEVREEAHLAFGAELVFSDINGDEVSRFNGTTGLYNASTVYTATASDGCSNVTAYCDSGDIAISGGCYNNQTSYGMRRNGPSINAAGIPEGWTCELSNSCYNIEATVICMDNTP